MRRKRSVIIWTNCTRKRFYAAAAGFFKRSGKGKKDRVSLRE
jgi:hypothetical protein